MVLVLNYSAKKPHVHWLISATLKEKYENINIKVKYSQKVEMQQLQQQLHWIYILFSVYVLRLKKKTN